MPSMGGMPGMGGMTGISPMNYGMMGGFPNQKPMMNTPYAKPNKPQE